MIADIQKLPPWNEEGSRPETGPMKFGDDWPGVFIRGDNAFAYLHGIRHLQAMLKDKPEVGKSSLIEGLAKLLASCRV
jgi:hypothetical protein